jgi:hypothetical protein
MTTNQLIALDFEFNAELEQYQYKDIAVEFNDLDSSEIVIKLDGFQLYGINDHRDLSKFIKLVYGE